jgi:DNA-binding XRE family transcriptional regulator
VGIRELRRDRRWSQEQLAEFSGLSLRTVQRIEASNRAGEASLRTLAATFEIDDSALDLELSMSKSSNGWKNRPAWVRAIFFGSGRIQMGSRQHIVIEKFAVLAGIVFVIVALLGTNGTIAPESAKVPIMLCASLMFLSAYLMSLIIRIGNRHAVWRWVEADKPDEAARGQ